MAELLNSSLGKWIRITGLTAAILFWIVSLLSISYNPWFIFTKHAFSDLGGPAAQNPWVYNYGLIIIGILVLLYSLSLITDAYNKIETVGGAFTFVAGLFLILIGIYPSGTQPHNFVSTWFFIQADLAMITWGIGLLFGKWKNYGQLLIALGVLGTIGAIVIDWPSAAVLEAYGILIISIWVILNIKIQFTRFNSLVLK